jgi:hypothetical protein
MDAYLALRLYVWNDMLALELRGFFDPGATAANIDNSGEFYFGDTFAQNWWSYERDTGDWGNRLTAMIEVAIQRTDPSTTRTRILKVQRTPPEQKN